MDPRRYLALSADARLSRTWSISNAITALQKFITLMEFLFFECLGGNVVGVDIAVAFASGLHHRLIHREGNQNWDRSCAKYAWI